MNTLTKFLLLPALTLLTISCSNRDNVVSSEDISTNQIYATFELYSDDSDTVTASAQLTLEGPPSDDKSGDDYISLRNGDQLWMTTGENLKHVNLSGDLFSELQQLANSQELFKSSTQYRDEFFPFFFFWSVLVPNQVHYNGELENTDENDTYTVSLLRKNHRDSLYSQITMPLEFQITNPESSSEFSRSSDDIRITWDITETDVSVEASVNSICPAGENSSYITSESVDTGELVIEAGELDVDLIGNCQTTITVRKVHFGELDLEFRGGYISANQVREIRISTLD